VPPEGLVAGQNGQDFFASIVQMVQRNVIRIDETDEPAHQPDRYGDNEDSACQTVKMDPFIIQRLLKKLFRDFRQRMTLVSQPLPYFQFAIIIEQGDISLLRFQKGIGHFFEELTGQVVKVADFAEIRDDGTDDVGSLLKGNRGGLS
jgi:hypothetical protein